MARHEYTPARRYVMQAVMALILAATIALAAAVGAHARRANRVELAPEGVTHEGVTVRFPASWKISPRSASEALLVARATESADGESGRTLSVRVQRLPSPLSPLQFAVTQLGRTRRPESEGVRMDEPPAMIPMTGYAGMLMATEGGSRRRGTMRKEVVAAVVLPSLRAIAVHLEGRGGLDAQDETVVREVAMALSVADEPALGTPGGAVRLDEAITFNAPAAFAPVAQTDPLRTDRRLWRVEQGDDEHENEGHFEGQWMTIETVGCLCPDLSAADPKQVEEMKSRFATLLLVRDPGWRGATIAPAGARVWRADWPSGSDGAEHAFPDRAYLMTHPSGRALLALFHGGFGATEFEPTWKELSASVQFLPTSDVASLEDVGTAEAARLRRQGYETLLSDRDVEWWLWTQQDALIGWSCTDFTGRGLVGRHTSRLRYGGGDEWVRLVHEFRYDDEGPQYDSGITRIQLDSGVSFEANQKVSLADGSLVLSYRHPPAKPLEWTGAARPQFVPGALLPLVMGKLSSDPMILLTDSFPGVEGIGPAEPLTVIVRPAGRESRVAKTDAGPMRCVTARVNGSGSVSRWYFRASGELEAVAWPGGVTQAASDEKVVRNNFPGDDLLAQ